MIVLGNPEFAIGMKLAGVKESYVIRKREDALELLRKTDKKEFIFGACAGAALYKKKLFEKVGFFDEDFFAYYEDVDLSFRAQLAGFQCLYVPEAVV